MVLIGGYKEWSFLKSSSNNKVSAKFPHLITDETITLPHIVMVMSME